MRLITEKAAAAFNANQSFRLANTSVHIEENYTILKLHGNSIARKERATGRVEITTSGWNTPTTKARLNGLPGVNVCTCKGQLMLSGEKWDGAWADILRFPGSNCYSAILSINA